MARIQHFVRGIASGYVALGANVAYTLASISLALHYLPKDRFGLWALIMQIAAYLALTDLGMSASIARFLAESKDEKGGGRYGSVLKTGQLVVTIQGVLIAGLGIGLAFLLPDLLQIDPLLRGEFTFFVCAQAVLTGMHFFTRVLGAPFWCHQRYDITNLSWTCGYGLSFAVLWAGFQLGWGLGAMLVANIAEFLLTTTIAVFASRRLHFWPPRGAWGTVSWPLFREMFAYGKDLFLMAAGTQLVAASHVIIVTRTMGLESAAVWAICSKPFILAQQLVGRIFDYSLGAFSEMLARNERDRLEKRYREILVITVSTSVFAGTAGALCNSGFVHLWTGGRIAWSPWNDVLMGILLVVRVTTRCHADFIALTRDIRLLKYIYLVEGIAFVALASILSRAGGFPVIILLAIALDVFLVGIYGLRRVAKFFGSGTAAFASGWSRAPLRAIALFLGFGILVALITSGMPTRTRFFVSAALAALAGPLMLWGAGLERGMRVEIGAAANRLLSRWRPRVP